MKRMRSHAGLIIHREMRGGVAVPSAWAIAWFTDLFLKNSACQWCAQREAHLHLARLSNCLAHSIGV